MQPNAYSTTESCATLPDVGRKLKALRKSTGKTQEQVASLTGLRQEALSRLESGAATDFSLSKFLRVLQALELELDFRPAVRRPSLEQVLQEVKAGANTGPDAR